MRKDKAQTNIKPAHKPFRFDGQEVVNEKNRHSNFMSEIAESEAKQKENSDILNNQTTSNNLANSDSVKAEIDNKNIIDFEYKSKNFSQGRISIFLKFVKIFKKNSNFSKVDSTSDESFARERSKIFFSTLKKISNFGSKAIRIGIAIFLFVLVLLVVAPKTFDNANLKFHLSQKATKLLGANVSIKGDVEVALIPTPRIIAHDVFIENFQPNFADQNEKIVNLYSKSLEIRFPLTKFFNKRPISGITATESIIEFWQEDAISGNIAESKFRDLLSKFEQKKENQKEPKNATDNNKIKVLETEKSGFKSIIFSIEDFEKSLETDQTLPNLEFVDLELDFFDKSGVYRRAKNTNANIEFKQDELRIEGSFLSEDVMSSFESMLKFNSNSSKPDSYFRFNSDILNLEISGNFPSKNDGIFSTFKGNISAEIKNFKKFYRSFLANNDSAAQNLSEAVNDIKINGEINIHDHEINVKNDINSSSINGKISFFAAKPKDVIIADLMADIENLNLDSFWIKNSNSEELRLSPIENFNFGSLPDFAEETKIDDEQEKINSKNIQTTLNKLSKNIDLAANLNFKKIILKETEIKDANLYATITNKGKISIAPLLFHLGDNSIFRVNGVIDNNDLDWKFVGSFDAAGEELGKDLKWVGLKSENLKFENLKNFRIYSDVSMGQYGARFNRIYLSVNQGESEIIGEIKISNNKSGRIISTNLKFDRLKLDNFFLSNRKNSYFSPGLLTKKLIWLNEIRSYHDIHLKFENLQYKDEEMVDQSFAMSIGQGYIIIPNTRINTASNDLNFDLAIDIAEKKQTIKFNIDANRLSIKNQDYANQNNQKNFFDRFYDLPSIEKFDGNITIKAKELVIDDKKFDNFSLSSSLKDGALNPIQIKLDLYRGQFAFKGAIQLFSDKVINGNFNFSNIEISDLLKDFFDVSSISGLSNIAGNITSSAKQKSDFLKRIRSEISFSTNRPTIEGLGLNDLVKKMFQLDTYRKELNEPDRIVFNQESKTTFKEAKGFMSIKDGTEGKFKIKLGAPAINSVFFGSYIPEIQSFDGSLNSIFLTGNASRQTPLNIAINLKYQPKNLVYVSNLDQVRQYLGLSKIKPEPVIISSAKSVAEDAQDNKTLLPKNPDSDLSKVEFEKITQEIENSKSIDAPTILDRSQDDLVNETNSEKVPPKNNRAQEAKPKEIKPDIPKQKDPMNSNNYKRT